MIEVGVARGYSIFFWTAWIICILGILLLPILLWYKKAVVNRSRIRFKAGSDRVTVEHGRWFVKDEDTVPVSAIDNIKLDHSVLGKMAGWCDITVVTRSEEYHIPYVSASSAKRFRAAAYG